MAILHPFQALRPVPDRVEEVASVPYDVISVEEAHTLAEGKPYSFLHVIRPEIDCPKGTDEHDDIVYEKGAENLRRFVESDVYVAEEEPSLYVYRLIMNGRAQIGIFGCVAVEDYDQGVIVRHEKTRPTKEEDRTRHIVTQQAHAEPVMLTFRSRKGINQAMATAMEEAPLYDFTADDGVQHTIWGIRETGELVEQFGQVTQLYIADGHHRCKAASRAAAALEKKDEEALYFPAVLFPMDQMHIMAYNRIVYRLPEGAEKFRKQLAERFELTSGADPVPQVSGQVSIYLNGEWLGLELPSSKQKSVAAQLDVARLGEHILDPLLGITNPRTDKNIDFVGGIRGTEELEKRVDQGDAALAISMYPTDIKELVAVSDASELMPPKSTWFEPKLRSGLLVHLFENHSHE